MPRFVKDFGTGKEIAIRDLAAIIARLVGFDGQIEFDETKPDGANRKVLDISKAREWSWESSIELSRGLEDTVEFFRVSS